MELDGYRIEGEIARGGMGVVYRALDVASGRRVALKLLLETSERFRERFRREAELLGRLQHPNVVTIHDAGEAKGRPYLVMELVEGETLTDRLHRTGPLTPGDAVELVASVARGAGHAHDKGLVHRDIKAENVIVRPNGEVVLTDFGLARDLEVQSELSKTGIFLGTPGYASPEQAAGQGKRVGPPSDVYGLGALLFELIAGQPPVTGTLIQVVVATISDPVPSLRERAPHAGVDATLDAICRRCLHKNPSARFASGDALAEALEAYVRGERVEGLPFSSRLGLPFALLGAVTVLGVAGLLSFGLPAPPTSSAAGTPSRSPLAVATQLPSASAEPRETPDPGLARAIRSVERALKSGPLTGERLDSKIDLLTRALEQAGAASNRRSVERELGDLYGMRAVQVVTRSSKQNVSDLRMALGLDPTPARRAALSDSLAREAMLAASTYANPDVWNRVKSLLNEAIRLSPKDPRPLRLLVQQSLTRRDWSQALEACEALAKSPADSLRAQLGAVNALRGLGRWQEGFKRLEDLLGPDLYRAPTHPRTKEQQQVWEVLADLETERGCFGRAKRALRCAGGESSRARGTRLGLLRVALEEGRPTRVLTLLEEPGGLGGRELSLYRGLANAALGDHAAALKHLDKIHGFFRLQTEASAARVRALEETADPEKALRQLDYMVKKEYLTPLQGLTLRGLVDARRGQHVLARKEMNEAIRQLLKAPDPWTALTLARRFVQWGRFHQPELTLKLADVARKIRQDDEDALANVLSATALSLLTRYDEASAFLDRVEQVHADRTDALLTRADLSVYQQDNARAEKAARRCLELEPTTGYAGFVGAEASLGQRKWKQALWFLKFCKPDRTSNAVPRALRGIARLYSGDEKGARADITWAFGKGPQRGRVKLAKSALLIFDGKHDEAIELVRADATGPDRGWGPPFARWLIARAEAARDKR